MHKKVEKCGKVWRTKKTLTLKVSVFKVAGGGHDPSTSGLWIRRSNQLSYPAIQAIDFSFAGAKVIHLFELNKFFGRNFQKKFYFLIFLAFQPLSHLIIYIKKTKNKGFLIFLYYLCTLNNGPANISNKKKVWTNWILKCLELRN